MADQRAFRDLASLAMPLAGLLAATDDPFESYRLCDRSVEVVAAVAAYLRDLQACGRPTTTLVERHAGSGWGLLVASLMAGLGIG